MGKILSTRHQIHAKCHCEEVSDVAISLPPSAEIATLRSQ